MKYIYGPVPSRRLGISLGVSPIPPKTCNYSCVYCQLGRTNHLINTPESFFPAEEIIQEFEQVQQSSFAYDVVTIVGEGEPTLYRDLKALILGLKQRSPQPIAVITNGALLYDAKVAEALSEADIVLPSMDAYDSTSFQRVNRPHGRLNYEQVSQGLIDFSQQYAGQLWLEIMLCKGMNDDAHSIAMLQQRLRQIRYDKLYLNTPIRPPAEPEVAPISHTVMRHISQLLGGISIDLLMSEGFQSDIVDHQEAIKSIIRRHPMNQYEIQGFLTKRGCLNPQEILEDLQGDLEVEVLAYRNYHTFRLKP